MAALPTAFLYFEMLARNLFDIALQTVEKKGEESVMKGECDGRGEETSGQRREGERERSGRDESKGKDEVLFFRAVCDGDERKRKEEREEREKERIGWEEVDIHSGHF